MKRSEVVAALEAARRAAQAYEKENMSKAVLESDRREVRVIEEETKRLIATIEQARMLGPSGSVCPACNGSGRV